VADVSSESPGLRELKKLRTRALLVDACGDLLTDTDTARP